MFNYKLGLSPEAPPAPLYGNYIIVGTCVASGRDPARCMRPKQALALSNDVVVYKDLHVSTSSGGKLAKDSRPPMWDIQVSITVLSKLELSTQVLRSLQELL